MSPHVYSIQMSNNLKMLDFYEYGDTGSNCLARKDHGVRGKRKEKSVTRVFPSVRRLKITVTYQSR